MKRILFLLPLLLIFGCDVIGYDSGWVDMKNGWPDAIRSKITKSDYQFIMSLNYLTGYVGSFTGDELTARYGVSLSLRQQTNSVMRLDINNGIKKIDYADFRAGAGRWDLYIIYIPKD